MQKNIGNQAVDPVAGAVAELSPEKRELLQMLLQEEGRYGLTYAQKQMWFPYQMDRGSRAYNVPVVVRIEGRVEKKALERGLNEIVRRHEILRTRFVEEEGSPVQVVGRELKLRLETSDLRGAGTEQERERAGLRIADEVVQRPFDLGRGPLLRAHLVQLGEQEQLLVLAIHHIVFDLWSGRVLLRELTELYQAYVEGKESPLEELPIQYADYAEWEREWMAGEGVREHLRYWKRQLQGLGGRLELPAEHGRSGVGKQKAGRVGVKLERDLCLGLRKLMKEEGVTLFMALLAGLQITLGRYSGQREVVVGTPVANRDRVELEALIGCFINMLVLRGDLGGGATLREVVRRVKRVAVEAYSHAGVPLQKLREELQGERGVGPEGLFQVTLGMQDAAGEGLEVGGLKFRFLQTESEHVQFDLRIAAEERGEEVRLWVAYRQELYGETGIARMMRHMETVLRGMVERGEERVWELELLSAAERAQVLGEWSGEDKRYEEKGIVELFEEQVKRSGRRVAVEYEGRKLTYAELNGRANQLGRYLRKRGVGREIRVGICMERGLEMVVGMVGVLKAGGGYVPLEPGHPQPRLEYMVGDAGVRVVLVQERTRGAAGKAVEEVVLEEEGGWEAIAGESWANLSRGRKREERGGRGRKQLAYVIYTSGTTGKPKGVMIAEEAILYRLRWAMERLGLGPGDAVLQKTAFGFDASVWEILVPLVQGGRLVMARVGGHQDSRYLAETVEKEGITVLQLVPSMLGVWLQERGVEGCGKKLKWVFSGGEALRREQVERFREKLPGVRLENLYGPTETSIDASSWSCAGDEDEEQAYVPLGRPLSNARIYIANEELALAPVGVVGEIYIGGAGLGRGYVGKPELTGERFIPNPYEGAGERLYRTGDLGRYRGDGVIEYVGRKDEQVKVRGYRIELGEIEAALAGHEGVKEAAVAVQGAGSGEKRLVGYVVPKRGAERMGEAVLKQYLRERLPEYMVPGMIVELEQLPHAANGKLDRRKLPEVEYASGREYVAPRSGTEEMVAQLWSEVLKVERVGAEDNFFELGGHSLLATQLMARVRETFGVEIGLGKLFEQASVEGLAGEIEKQLRGGGEGRGWQKTAIGRRGEEEKKKLSYAQQRLWFLEQLEPGGSAYNLSSAIRLEGELKVEVLERSLNEVVKRHETLRTRFEVNQEGEPQQIVRQAGEVRIVLKVEEIKGGSEEEKWQEVKRLAEAEERKPFDLKQGPLVRGRLLRVSEQEHVALLTLHHIVSDGWSQSVLVEEMGKLYAGWVKGEEGQLERLPIQYGDYAAWQREWLQGEVLEEELEYWRKQLAGMSGVLELPTDYPRPAVQGYGGAHYYARVEPGLGRRLQELARKQNVTLYMLLLGSLDVLLWRYSGEQDIAVGSPIANRTQKETEKLIGFFVNTLVLRNRVEGSEGFAELLKGVRETALGAYAHQDVPFERVVEELKPERDLSRSPLFQVMFALQNQPQQELQLPGLKLRAVESESGVSKFDLTFYVNQMGEGLEGVVEYNTGLYQRGTVERMWGHWEQLLRGIAGETERAVAELTMLSEAERRQVVEEWNRTERDYAGNRTVVDLFEEQARRTPQRVAVRCAGAGLTYDALNRRANQLAHHLATLGLRQEQVVGLWMERDLNFLAGMLGIWKAGAAYLPFDVKHPATRLLQIIQQSAIQCIATEHRLAARVKEVLEKVPPEQRPLVVVVDELPGAENETNATPHSGLPRHSKHLAYVIYTSGSTGIPKGAMVEHSGMLNHLRVKINDLQLTENDCIAQTASQSFDISVWQFMAVLLVGGLVEIVADDIAHDPAALWQFLKGSRITILELVPSMLAAVLDDTDHETSDLDLRWLLVTGEAVSPRLCSAWLKQYPEVSLLNAYGPTECSDDVSHHHIKNIENAEERVPIGRPVGNLRIYIVDRFQTPVPAGVYGEVYVGGIGVGRGYLNDPVRTAQSFVPDALGSLPGARLYATGDLARFRSDGVIDLLGRVDHQVKIRGFRIEPGEVELVLARHDSVSEAAVVALSMQGEKRLIGYVVLKKSDGATASDKPDLKAYLKSRLPEYMVPAVIIELERMPLTANGKIDRRALPQPDASVWGPQQEYIAPRTDTEKALARVWTDLLKVPRAGVRDNFFDLGGHSLLATQLMSRVRRTLQIEMPLRAVFERPTIEGLAQLAENGEYGKMPVKATPRPSANKLDLLDALLIEEGLHEQKTRIPVQKERARFVTSFMQQRLWFLDQLDPGAVTYNVSSAVKLEGQLDVALLERSLNEVVRRHETLRTRFELGIHGQPEQIVSPEVEMRLPIIPVPDESGKDKNEMIAGLIRAEAAKPFDLKNGPLFRAQLLKLNALEHIALFTMHHIICDGWSQGVLVSDVVTFYAAHAQGRPYRMEPLPVQYGDYAEWQRARLQGEVLEKELDYWRDVLAGLNGVLELPTDRPRPAVQTYRGAQHEMRLSPELTRRLNEFARRENATLYMLLLAGLQALLWRYSGQDDIAVGAPVANRTMEETEQMIGFFANTLVMRSRMQTEESFHSFLQRVHEMALGAYAHQEVPFETLVDDLNPGRDLSRSPLFQVMFVLQNAPNEEIAMPGLKLTMLRSSNDTAKFDLLIGMEQAGDVLLGGIEYATDLFDGSTIDRMARHWVTLLENVLDRPAAFMADLPLLSDQERREIVFDWNRTTRRYPDEKTFPELIEEQVEKTPQAVAVVFERQRITYAELNSRANQLAHFLRKKGVAREHLAGICMERSVEMVIALLGIVKAGAAYVPLDPGYPPERLSYMLEDCDAGLLLTQERLTPVLPELNSEIICLDRDWNAIASEPTHNPQRSLSGENLAYVIYTSGSTGRPKGAMNRHDGVRNRLQWMQAAYRLDESDRVLQKTPFSFDVSVWEFFWPLMTGARLVVARPGGHQDPAYLAKLIQQEGITTIHFVPSMLQVFVEEPGVDQCRSLRRVICSGEALTRSLQEKFHDRIVHVELHNLYGPTEAAVDVTWWKCEHETRAFTVPLGWPIDNIQIHILDQRLEPVPVGVAGEIHIGGIGLGRGYWRKPELTAERFIPNLFSEKSGERLYRTGDLGCYRSSGVVEFLGRLDHQVKIRGFRIELGEVEAALLSHDGVREAAVAAQDDGSGNKKLVAYVVLQDTGQKPTADVLQRYLREQLPDYMVPGIIVELESMPLSPNGKLDRKALPKAGAERNVAFVPSRTPAEKLLTDIWSDVLKIERIGIDENFFNLGGDSILSIQVRARAQMAGLNFSLQDMFRYQTIRELARHKIAEVQEHAPKTEPFSLVGEEDRGKLPDFVEDAYPLAALQLGMLFHQEFAPVDAVMYHNVNSYHVRGRWEREKFLDAAQQVTARHPALRTSFDFHNFSVPLQLVHRNAYFPVEEDDLCGLTEEEQEAALAEFMVNARRRRFDLSKPPQLRFHVHRRSDDRFQFTFTENHAIIDGWSLHATLAEVFEIYSKLLAGEPVHPEPSPRTTYRDFVAMEKLDTESDEHRRFWSENLAGAEFVPVPDLAASGPVKKEARTLIQGVQISPESSDGLKHLAQSLGVPLKSVLLAAHMKAMAVVTGSRDVLSGLVANGRLEVEDGDQVRGLFLNTVPFRLLLSGGTFAELVAAAFAAEKEMLPHRRYPLALIQRNMGVESLFDNYFNFAHFHVVENVLQSDGLEILGGNKYEATNFKLYAAFSLAPAGSRDVWLELQYDDSRIAREQIESIAQYYVRILDALASDAEQHHEEISFLSQAERAQLVAWNQTSLDYSPTQMLIGRLEKQALETPDATAVQFGDESLEYGELHQKAGQLANYLRRKGARPEVLVGIRMERSLEMMVALLAVLKTGAAYLPLSLGDPQDRLQYVMEDAQIKVVLTQERLLGSIPFAADKCVCLDRDWPLIGREEPLEPLGEVLTGDNLAYVLYTSGSTGKPKGVMVRQRSLSNFAAAMDASLGNRPPERWLAATSLSFDISVLELFWPLTHGSQIILHPEDKTPNPELLLAEIQRHAVTHLQCTPSMMSLLMSVEAAPEVLKGLKKLLLGGESLPFALARDLQQIAKGEIINLYGPTETTIWSTIWVLQPDLDVVSIGRPIANTQIHILDDQLDQLPIGTTGEIYIAGDGVARGYLARPDLTAEKFLPNCFSHQPGERMYRTGDLGHYRKDGTIECLGRTDDQVKIGGRRSELGEIESVVASYEAVREAAVAVRQDGAGVKRLIAYVVFHDAAPKPGYAQIRDFVRSKLPDYMVPAAIVELDRMPLTSNGKLNRKALPQPRGENWGQRTPYVAPRTGTQEVLSQIWAGVLGVDRVGLKDNFFDLGGHSLLATQLIARVRNAFHVEVSLREFFDQASLEALSLSIEETLQGGGEGAGPATPILRRTAEEKKQLSFAQQRLWFMNLFEPESAFYNLPAALLLEGKLNIDALQRSLNEVMQRHEILRTRFDLNASGEPEQLVQESFPVELPVVEIEGETDQEKLIAANRLAIEEAARPFNLKTGPLLRVRLLRIAPERHVVLFTLHHIASDEWSQGILIEEVGSFYAAFAQNKQPSLEPLAIQYGDYAAWQRETLQGEGLQRQIQYWRAQLDGMNGMLTLPADRPRPAVQTFAGANYRVVLEPELGRRARELARQESATLFMVLLAAFDVLLWRYSGQKDIVVGTPIANRTREETEKLIGFFVNTLVLRTEIEDQGSFRDLLKKVRGVTLGAYAHQDLPFEKLVEELNPERDLSRSPLFQVLFTLQNARPRQLILPGLKVEGVEAENLTAKFDFTIFLNELPSGELESLIEYNTDLFDQDTIARIARHWHTLVAGIAGGADGPLAGLSLLTPSERHQTVVEWNKTERAYERETALIRLFEDQARKYPSRLAVVFEEKSLNYAALNQQANQLARYLQSKGIGPETLVGICIERSIEMMVGLLGIWKAGAAYVPLDPAYPVERLKQMLDDCGARMILTQEQLAAALPHTTAERVLIDRDWPQIAVHGAENLLVPIGAENLAYVIYTSGSTGKPKGVMVRHGSLANFATAMDECLAPDLSGTWLAVTSLSFDISVLEVFWTLSRGFRVIIQPGGIAGNVESVLKQIKAHEVTHFQCTPSMAGLLLLDPEAQLAFAGLKKLLVGGENLPLHVGSQLQQMVGGEVINVYGPTETTIWSSSWKLHEAMPGIAIGKPLANTQLYVVDEQLEPVPVGAVGELYIGGHGVARGYFGRPDLTAERFIPDHLGGVPGERLYHTGDLARYRADGNIDYIGRADQQMKLRGYRIELGEIESTLAAHEMVREAAVVVRDGPDNNRTLVGYVVLNAPVQGASSSPSAADDQLREYLRGKLPEYMVPAVIVELDQMPLTANGKLNRRSLPKPQSISRREDYVSPRNEMETKIAGAWTRVLGVEQVGIHDNFFDLGGHSLLLARLSIELRLELGREISLVHLFRYPSIAELSGSFAQPAAGAVEVRTEAAVEKLEAGKDRLKRVASRRKAAGEKVPS